MTSRRDFLKGVAGAALVSASPLALATSPRLPVRKMEIIEFFSYGCGHCNKLFPALMEFKKTLPAGVEVAPMHVGMNSTWKALARLHVALETMNRQDLVPSVFSSIHNDNIVPVEPRLLKQWASKYKINVEELSKVMHSDATNKKVDEADALAKQAGITGVPSIWVDRKVLLDRLSPQEYIAKLQEMVKKVA